MLNITIQRWMADMDAVAMHIVDGGANNVMERRGAEVPRHPLSLEGI